MARLDLGLFVVAALVAFVIGLEILFSDLDLVSFDQKTLPQQLLSNGGAVLFWRELHRLEKLVLLFLGFVALQDGRELLVDFFWCDMDVGFLYRAIDKVIGDKAVEHDLDVAAVHVLGELEVGVRQRELVELARRDELVIDAHRAAHRPEGQLHALVSIDPLAGLRDLRGGNLPVLLARQARGLICLCLTCARSRREDQQEDGDDAVV